MLKHCSGWWLQSIYFKNIHKYIKYQIISNRLEKKNSLCWKPSVFKTSNTGGRSEKRPPRVAWSSSCYHWQQPREWESSSYHPWCSHLLPTPSNGTRHPHHHWPLPHEEPFFPWNRLSSPSLRMCARTPSNPWRRLNWTTGGPTSGNKNILLTSQVLIAQLRYPVIRYLGLTSNWWVWAISSKLSQEKPRKSSTSR